MRADYTTIFARPHMPITTFNALSMEPALYVPAAISNLLLPGLTLLTGPTHCGKTSFALQLMQAVATGELPFGEDLRFQPVKGSVLYLGLQHSRLQLQTLQGRLSITHRGTPVPGNIHCTNNWGPLTPDEGLRDLETWLTTHAEDLRLLVIDNFDELRALFRGKDRDLLALLRRAAERFRISVLLLHTCKPSSPLIDYAEHHLQLKRLSVPEYCQLEVSSASLRPESHLFYSTPEQIEFRLVDAEEALALDKLSAHKVLTPERLEALALFHERGGPLSPADVAEALSYDSVNARQLLHGMVRAHLLCSPAYGRYEIHPALRGFLPRLLGQLLTQETEATESDTKQNPEENTNSVDTIAHTSNTESGQPQPKVTPPTQTSAQPKTKPANNRAWRRLQQRKKR